MHKLLAKQLAKATKGSGGVDLATLCEYVSAAYEEADHDRRRTDRSISLMIEELDELNSRDREQLLGQLKSQNLRFETALNHMTQGLAMFDGERRLIVCNARYGEVYGLPPDMMKPGTTQREILEHRVAAGIYAGSDADAYIRDRIANADEAQASTRLLNFPDGRTINVAHRPMPGGGWVSTHDDVTALKQKEASFRLLFESNPVPMWVYDRESLRFLAVNAAAVEHYGYDQDEFLSMTILDVRPPEEQDIVSEFVRGMKDAYGAERVWRQRKKDGTEIQIVSYGQALTYEGRQAVLSAIIDITERVETEHRIREQNQALSDHEEALRLQNVRFDTALAHMSQGLCLFDAEQRLVVSNKKYAELYGLTVEQTRPGTTLRAILECRVAAGAAPDDADEYIETRLREVSEGPSYTINQLRDGRTIAVLHRPIEGGGWVATHEDITDRRRAEAQIAHMAHHDALTDLPNRVLLRERMNEALKRVRRGDKLAVLCLDLDHFKNVNDSLGHPAGDLLLETVADRLRKAVRDTDSVARLGGDEFAIVQVAVEQPKDATVLAQRVIEALAEPFTLNGHHVVVGTSVGIAVSPHDGTDPDQLLKNADMALYRAKSDGRGTFRFFEPEMDAKMKVRRALEIDLRRALADDEFELFYQPIVNLERDEISCFEALLRWHHPERGMIPPADFIPLAEEIGLIVPLGEWVLRNACTEAARWPAGVTLAVNLSPMQFKSRSLALTVVSALAASGLPPTRLELEITETVLMQDNEATLSVLHQLRDIGVRISMDDFGTGYSSLSYLRRFPFDKIKIDRSFVRDLAKRDDSRSIVRAVTGLGSSLGMVTTAEGVETQEQLDMLRAEGCTEVQGYLFSPPRPSHEIRALLLKTGGRPSAVA